MTTPTRPDEATGGALGKTQLRRIDQYRDRWTSRGTGTGLLSLSDKPSPAELSAIELFADYDDKFLERISPDVSIAVWQHGSVLFEEGSYLDLAFFVLEGTVEVAVHGLATGSQPAPIFDLSRTVIAPGATTLGGSASEDPGARRPRAGTRRPPSPPAAIPSILPRPPRSPTARSPSSPAPTSTCLPAPAPASARASCSARSER